MGIETASAPSDELRRSSAPRGRFDLWRARVETIIIGGLMGAAMALVFYTVLMRYVSPANAPRFTDEIVVYGVMWAVMLAWGGVSRSRNHVRADLVLHVMPPRLRHLSEIAANVVGFAFALFLGWFGYLVAYEAWDFGDLSPTNIRFPLWVYYSALPIGALLMALGHARAAMEMIVDGPTDEKLQIGEEI
ncbi:TRAP transporter small permease [Aliihoeflea sp. 2WW]|uniref:TRAP transporter small permease n=1 Tax=Aliihoeflea sp. 2WW TaxID=1381123 RepID=UPI00137868E6|nr:TRAP transporter small permease [Aliihoeflea sp. 2WW]